MIISRHPGIEKDFKKLKRFPAAVESLQSWERLFSLKGLMETPGINPYPGFGNSKIYKARVVPLKENCGKSKGYRLIFQMLTNESCKLLIFSRHGIYKSEKERGTGKDSLLRPWKGGQDDQLRIYFQKAESSYQDRNGRHQDPWRPDTVF